MPDLKKLPWALEDGVKVFHISADVVRREFLPGRVVDCWGFNGLMPGPLIEINQGDRVRFVVENNLPEVFSMHWHGIELPFEMDGVPGLIQDPILPGAKFVYEFTVHQHGTFFYHSHMPMQEMMGMIGMMVIHPGELYEPRADRDFGLIFQEWAILPNNTVPNTLSMEFNWLTINGKAGPDTTPMLVKQGERVRIRMVNLGMDHHPIHLHGNTFYVTGTEGGRVPRAAWTPQPSFGRGLGVGSAYQETLTQLPVTPGSASLVQQSPHARHHVPPPGGKLVPGYPQDMFMVMDEMISKPETHGLRASWTAGMMGMMTLVRVLTPEKYDEIQEIKRNWKEQKPATHIHK